MSQSIREIILEGAFQMCPFLSKCLFSPALLMGRDLEGAIEMQKQSGAAGDLKERSVAPQYRAKIHSCCLGSHEMRCGGC